MSRLEQLFAELCPDGVEFGELINFASINKGEQLNLTKMSDDEPFPVMNGGIKPSGYFNEFNNEENTIAVSQGGASAGYVNFLTTKFWAGAHCYVVKPKSKRVVNKYLYYLIKDSETKIQESKYGAGIPGLNKSTLEKLSIPIPPIVIQEEIVRILDTFTALEAELEEKINAELEARTKQYEYYRDSLLDFTSPTALPPAAEPKQSGEGEKTPYPRQRTRPTHLNQLIQTLSPDGVEYFHLGELCISLKKETITQDKLNDTFEYPVMNSGRAFYGRYVEYNNGGNALVIASRGEYAGFISYITQKFWAGGLCYPYRSINEELAQTNYLFYVLKNSEQKIMDTLVSRGSIPALNKADIDKFLIPLPPLPVQKEIVAILDRFDALVNDLKNGLPAEISARRKQYEYYRNQLLTFEPKNMPTSSPTPPPHPL